MRTPVQSLHGYDAGLGPEAFGIARAGSDKVLSIPNRRRDMKRRSLAERSKATGGYSDARHRSPARRA
ncbi:MAG: hypothetical protein ACJ78T_14795, partial [Myxococcales bacterium]